MNSYKDLNEAFVQSLSEVKENHSLVNSRGTLQREILWHSLEIRDPTALSIQVPARRFKPSYAITEWFWYLSEDRNVKNIGKLANIWQRIANGQNEVESNYGFWLHGLKNGKTQKNQWQWVIDELFQDRDTRRASLTINQSHHKGQNNADYPCTQYIPFFIRDNRLHLGVHMRSNDAVFGFCNDVFTFCMYQQMMLNELNALIEEEPGKEKIELGHYFHSAGSFHVYETHFSMMDKILDNYAKKYEDKDYPELKKYKLRDNITLEYLRKCVGTLPRTDMSKEEIELWTNKKMEEIYA